MPGTNGVVTPAHRRVGCEWSTLLGECPYVKLCADSSPTTQSFLHVYSHSKPGSSSQEVDKPQLNVTNTPIAHASLPSTLLSNQNLGLLDQIETEGQ